MFSFPSQGGRAPEVRLPLIARLTLYALGAVEGRRIRRPVDPVAAWLIRTHPSLLHSESAPAAFTTIRARTSIVDELIAEEVDRTRSLGRRMALMSFGGGFDARWYRLLPIIGETIETMIEIESPGLLEHKGKLLADSPYAALWERVEKRPQAEGTWAGTPRPSGEDMQPVVIMERLAGRLEPEALRALLGNLRERMPEARIIMGLPGYSGSPGAWSGKKLHDLGWRIDADVRLSPRGRLVAQSGKEICAGMHGLRVLRLLPLI